MKHTTRLPEAIEKLRMATLLERQNRLDEAIDAFKDFVRLDPEALWEWQHLGNLLRKLGRTSEAEEAYLAALELDPVNPITLRALALTHIKNGQSAKAEELLRKAIACDEIGIMRCELNLDLSHILLLQKRWEESKTCLLNAILADSSSVGSYYNLAYLYSSMEKWDDALSVCIKLLNIQPNARDAYALMRHILHKTGKGEAGDTLMRRFLALHAKEEEINRQWNEVVAQAQSDFSVSPFQFELFLPKEFQGGKKT